VRVFPPILVVAVACYCCSTIVTIVLVAVAVWACLMQLPRQALGVLRQLLLAGMC
jgi:hypothetical protein